jgi:hypothetical protein
MSVEALVVRVTPAELDALRTEPAAARALVDERTDPRPSHDPVVATALALFVDKWSKV